MELRRDISKSEQQKGLALGFDIYVDTIPEQKEITCFWRHTWLCLVDQPHDSFKSQIFFAGLAGYHTQLRLR